MKKKQAEDKYIQMRKRKAFFYSCAFRVMQLFPIKKNKIVFWTFEGSGGYCCNPKYIAEELLRRERMSDKKVELVWLVKDTSKEFPREIKKERDTFWNRIYHLSTACVWVSNTRTLYGTRKRKKQTYIQTWHGTLCIKPIGKYRGDLFPKIAYLVSEHDSKLIDYVLSGSGWCDKHYRDGLIYNGEIIRTGSPRCDMLIEVNEEQHRSLRERYGIPSNAKILMYAPTFRGGSQSTNRTVEVEEGTIDFEHLISSLESRFGGEWYVFLRLHPQLAAKKEKYKTSCDSERLIDVTFEPDMNELMVGIDAFITDYSSAIFEAMLMRIPCFIYADDLEEYVKDRGDLFFDMHELPFPVALKNQELMNNVQEFNEEIYLERLESFIKEQDIVEDGQASKRVADMIEACITEEQKGEL